MLQLYSIIIALCYKLLFNHFKPGLTAANNFSSIEFEDSFTIIVGNTGLSLAFDDDSLNET